MRQKPMPNQTAKSRSAVLNAAACRPCWKMQMIRAPEERHEDEREE